MFFLFTSVRCHLCCHWRNVNATGWQLLCVVAIFLCLLRCCNFSLSLLLLCLLFYLLFAFTCSACPSVVMKVSKRKLCSFSSVAILATYISAYIYMHTYVYRYIYNYSMHIYKFNSQKSPASAWHSYWQHSVRLCTSDMPIYLCVYIKIYTCTLASNNFYTYVHIRIYNIYMYIFTPTLSFLVALGSWHVRIA